MLTYKGLVETTLRCQVLLSRTRTKTITTEYKTDRRTDRRTDRITMAKTR